MPGWQRLTDGNLRGRLTNLRSAVIDLLAGNYLPSFTDHSVAHSDRICDLIDKLTEPLTEADQLSDKEAFILYAAAYLHDAGLQHQRAGETQVVAAILAARFPGRAWGDLDIETRRSIVREHHHRISGEMITQSINAPYPTLGIQLTDDWCPGQIRAIAVAHNLYMDAQDADEYRDLTKDWGGVRMSLLSALLRLADILDESRRRSQLYLERTRELSLESRMHWWRHYYVAEIEIDPRDRVITLWFDFPPDRRAQYRELVPPLQVPWVRAEFDRHAELLARHNLLWHFKVSETPEHQSTSRPMDDELERFVLEKLAKQRQQQAERDRLLVLEQLRVARPTIERELTELRAESNTAAPEDKLKGFLELARHLYRLGGRRDAWITLLSEYDRSAKLVDASLKFDLAMELAEMMFADGAHDHVARLLHDLAGQEESLTGTTRFRFVRLLARGYLECVLNFRDDAAVWLGWQGSLTPAMSRTRSGNSCCPISR
jgi:hypothetical protein